MNLSTEQLKEIEEMAFRLIAPSLIAINIGVNEMEFVDEIKIADSPARIAFYRGYLKQEIMLRDSIIKAAANGSNPAQIELIRYFKDLKQHLNYE